MATQKDARVNLVISSERKQEWEEAAEEHPQADGSLSQLIRVAVSRELSGRNNQTGAGEELEESIADIVDQNRKLLDQLRGVEARLGSIEQAVQQDPEIQKLANEVFGLLPTEEELKKDERGPGFKNYAESHAMTPQGDVDHSLLSTVPSGRVEHLALVTDASEHRIRQALDQLQADTALVRVTKDGRYFKEV